jgi:hypothetical protein
MDIFVPLWLLWVPIAIAIACVCLAAWALSCLAYIQAVDLGTRVAKCHKAFIRFLAVHGEVEAMSRALDSVADDRRKLARELLIQRLCDISMQHYACGWYDNIVPLVQAEAMGKHGKLLTTFEEVLEMRELGVWAGGWPNENGHWDHKDGKAE